MLPPFNLVLGNLQRSLIEIFKFLNFTLDPFHHPFWPRDSDEETFLEYYRHSFLACRLDAWNRLVGNLLIKGAKGGSGDLGRGLECFELY